MSAVIYLEGGGDSKELHVRCREGFRRLLERCGFAGRMPRLFASGGRQAAYEDFKRDHAEKREDDFVAILIDSEEPLSDIEATWKHLKRRDGWSLPTGAEDEQVLFMTTCMETWIVCDRDALSEHFGADLQPSALLPLANLEARERDEVQGALRHATRDCRNAYAKGKRSFQILGKLDPQALQPHLPSFARVRRILGQKLPTP